MANWLERYGRLWQRKAGAPPNWKRLAGELGILKRAGYSDEQIWRHWRVYVEQTAVRHLSPTRFRETFNGHTDFHRIDKELDQRQRARESEARSRVDGGPGRPDPLLALRQHAPGRKAAGRAGEKRGQDGQE